MDAQGITQSKPNLRVSKNNSELYIFDNQTNVVNSVLQVRKSRFSALHVSVSDDGALDVLKLPSTDLEALIVSAKCEQANRERERQ